jgi:hypothetical protein
MKVSTLAGEPLLVDELSLIKTSPVRVKMNVRDPIKLKGFVTIFINKVGYEISFVSDKYKDKSAPYYPLLLLTLGMMGMETKMNLK